jgi:hypothetical protein
MASRVLLGVAALVALLAIACARVILSGEKEIAASTRALDAGDAEEAITCARRAAQWYAPGAPHVRVAYDRLSALALAAEEHRRDDLALAAWRATRLAAIETRWPGGTHAAELDRANQEIARITAKRPDAAEPDAQIAAEELQKLQRHEPPRAVWTVTLGAGFLLLVIRLGPSNRRPSRSPGMARREARHGPQRRGRDPVATRRVESVIDRPAVSRGRRCDHDFNTEPRSNEFLRGSVPPW